MSSKTARLRSASAPSPANASTSSSISSCFGASGSRWGRRGESGASGTRAGPKVKRRNERTVEIRRATVAGASRGLPRSSPVT